MISLEGRVFKEKLKKKRLERHKVLKVGNNLIYNL